MTEGFRQVIRVASLLLSVACPAAYCGAPQVAQQSTENREQPVDEKQSSSRTASKTAPRESAGENSTSALELLGKIPADQKSMWTSPFHLQAVDADWLVPFGIVSATMLATDTEYSKHLSNSESRLNNSRLVSKSGMYALGALDGGIYLWGHVTHDDHKKETGLLAADAALQSFFIARGLNSILGRENPLQNDSQGSFFQGGHSFPSQGAAAAWSIAGVITHEYPGPVTKLLVYGLASAVTASSISSKQHFPSDVLIGSAIGWFVGQEVYRRHHEPSLGGGEWQGYSESHAPDLGDARHSVGSPYVSLDSWVYPAIERLAAFGYIDTAFLGMRPWTRLECATLVAQAGEQMEMRPPASEDLSKLQALLAAEFRADLEASSSGDNRVFRLESGYTGFTQISGEPLNDSYHFGQTIIDNFGRPYQEGMNSVTGFSAYATNQRFSFDVRGEYEHSPSAPGYSESVRTLISNLDGTPVAAAGVFSSVNQFRLLDAYVAANVADWNFSFGNQSLWWGPADGSALLFSNNAVPILMFRANNIAPFQLPWIFHYLGPMKLDVFFGKLTGENQVPQRPLLHGEKISFKPTKNLELGFSRTVEMGGVGRPLTIGHLWLSYTSLTSPINETPNTDPGKRTGGFDFSYRLPFLRDWLTLYSDSLSDDDPSPVDAPRRAAVNPGLYLTHFPKLVKLDFRVEGVNTNTPSSSRGGHYVYFDDFYRNLYTNQNNLIGSWVGRQGQGIQAWTTYHASARNSIQVGYRHAKTACDFIPGGETLNDEFVRADWWVSKSSEVSGFLQHETWLAPVLATRAQSNWTSSLTFTYWPGKLFSKQDQPSKNEHPPTSEVAP
jgi:Capsule assembly protein Wzi/PAP2 superfamily